MTKLEGQLEQLQQAIDRLEEVMTKKKDPIVRDSAIKRFEIVYELSWKTTKSFLEEELGVKCNSPRSCFKEAFQQGIIEYDEFWLELIKLRNLTTHTYNEETAEKVYNHLEGSIEHFRELSKTIENKK